MELDLKQHLIRQIEFSLRAFGPGNRREGILDHIVKEVEEVRKAKDGYEAAREFIDIAILALDGVWRSVGPETRESLPWRNRNGIAEWVIAALLDKQSRNEERTWPDWRTADPNKAIEHDRSKE